jgi:hypothetical protein
MKAEIAASLSKISGAVRTRKPGLILIYQDRERGERLPQIFAQFTRREGCLPLYRKVGWGDQSEPESYCADLDLLNERADDWQPIAEETLPGFCSLVDALEGNLYPLDRILFDRGKLFDTVLNQYHDKVITGYRSRGFWASILKPTARDKRVTKAKFDLTAEELMAEAPQDPIGRVCEDDSNHRIYCQEGLMFPLGPSDLTLAGVAEQFTSWREGWERKKDPERYELSVVAQERLWQGMIKSVRSLEPDIGFVEIRYNRNYYSEDRPPEIYIAIPLRTPIRVSSSIHQPDVKHGSIVMGGQMLISSEFDRRHAHECLSLIPKLASLIHLGEFWMARRCVEGWALTGYRQSSPQATLTKAGKLLRT